MEERTPWYTKILGEPMVMVYYYDTDLAYYTPWSEEIVANLAESEDGKGKFYFFLGEV
jgi:hypothetical protein